MLLRMLYDEKLAQAAYLVGCQRTGEAILIDPQRDIDRYVGAARREGLTITAVAETHIHADFLSGARELAESVGAHLYLSAEGGDDWQYRWLNHRTDGGTYTHTLLRDGDTFNVGNIRFTTRHTPGHTPEHLSYIVTDIGGGASEPMGIMTGDFVFVGDVGRPDLLESAAGAEGASLGAAERLYDSLVQFDMLPEYLQVWPGHGAGSACGKALGAVPQTTVGYERRMNAALDSARGDRNRFVETILSDLPEPPLYFGRMKRENREGPAILGELPTPERITDATPIASQLAGVTVIDTRPWPRFSKMHITGALHAPLTRAFTTTVGSYADPGLPIVLVVETSRVDEAVRDLVRIGYDRFIGFIDPLDVDAIAKDAGAAAHSDEITAAELINRLADDNDIVLDVRSHVEFARGHLADALNITHTRLAERLDAIPPHRRLYVHCQSGVRSAAATAFLAARGFHPINVAGGYAEIKKASGARGVPS